MNPTLQTILIACACFAALGLLFGLLLAVASKVFEVKKDERAEQVLACLPGANCGGCGYVGCAQLAEAIVKGEASPAACTASPHQTAVDIAAILGQEPPARTVRKRAQVMCSGDLSTARFKYAYDGASDCVAATQLGGGTKLCLNGCIGFGTCVSKCAFHAISLENGLAKVDYHKCTGCGACVKACPKGIIRLIPYDAVCWVGCMSVSDAKTTNQQCSVGCISCRICEKNCPFDAIHVENGRAVIDYDKCTGCSVCVSKCPRKIIHKKER
ncbi:MAG: 4Fe-4S dicluster domain-containing protein [Ruminococcaceae bacterium]|nr:4Fe-4S dicluster domain-containing protein [Oscillospiraceae bacterium]